MNTATYQSEVAKAKQLTKFAISLIRAHYEPDMMDTPDSKDKKDAFLETAREVAKYFDQIKEYQLATYVRVLIGDERDVWVPM